MTEMELRKQEIERHQKIQAYVEEQAKVTRFPAGKVPMWFKGVLQRALTNESQRTMECDWPTLYLLRNADPALFTVQHMGYALNALESKTPAQLAKCTIPYNTIQEAVWELCIIWNDIKTGLVALAQDKYPEQKGKATLARAPKKTLEIGSYKKP